MIQFPKFKILLFGVIFFSGFLVWQNAEAATYYVCSSGCNDSNGGTTTGQCVATIARAHALAGSTDTINFCPSGTWIGNTTSCNGSSAPYNAFLCPEDGVKYIGNDTDTWGGSGKAKLMINTGQSGMMVGINGVNDVTVQGFEMDINEQNASGVYVGINNCSNMSGITISDNAIHDTLSGTGIWNYGIVVGIGGCVTSDINIIGNTIYNISAEPLTIYPTAGSATNILVRGNTVYNGGEMGDGWNIGLHIKHTVTNVIAEFNHFYNVCHGVNFETEYSHGNPSGITIRYNIINDLVNNPSCGGVTWTDRDGTNISTNIYGNLFYGITGNDISLSSGDTVNIYNNSIYKTVANYAVRASSGGTVNFRNNIIYITNAEAVYDINGDIDNYSNNILYRASGNVLNYGGTSYTSSGLPAAWGYSTNPAFTGGTLPTGFTGTYGTNMVPNTDYFQLTNDSPAKDKGATLGSPFNGSINGAGLATPLLRPQGSGYDIGAYEYASETTDTTAPASPTGLSVQ